MKRPWLLRDDGCEVHAFVKIVYRSEPFQTLERRHPLVRGARGQSNAEKKLRMETRAASGRRGRLRMETRPRKKVAMRCPGAFCTCEPRGESLIRQDVPYHRAPSSGRLVSFTASLSFVVVPSSRTATETS
jgi:hypothetical protein